ncbi:MAG: hypothetical protein BWY27_00773 [Bacteroidetes bacterium ADurb.Bin234]|nr:MAG: hypothetical protein BWY27_00773 [Bacteroidetes bacterium ADurb.Bin234]
MKYSWVVLFLVFCLSCTNNIDNNIAIKPLDFDTIQTKKENEICEFVASYIGFDNVSILTYYNRSQDSIIFPLPNVNCFNAKGEEIIAPSCYSSLPQFISNCLIRDSVHRKLPYRIETINDKTSIVKRISLHQFLINNKILLLNDLTLDESMLPKSDYYLFIDWFFYAPTESMAIIAEMDSILSTTKGKATLVVIHACAPKEIVK